MRPGLLQLPAEIRLQIYGHIAHDERTTGRLMNPDDLPVLTLSRHDIYTAAHRFFLLRGRLSTFAALVRTCRLLYNETIPFLYESSTFNLQCVRHAGKRQLQMHERWKLLVRFLGRLSEFARAHVRAVRLPLLRFPAEQGAFIRTCRTVAGLLPHLRRVEFEVELTPKARSVPPLHAITLGPSLLFLPAEIQVVFTSPSESPFERFFDYRHVYERQARGLLAPHLQKHAQREARAARNRQRGCEDEDEVVESSLSCRSALFALDEDGSGPDFPTPPGP